MGNKFETRNHLQPNMMTQFTKDLLQQRLLALQKEAKQRQLEIGATMDKGDEYHDNFAYEQASREVNMLFLEVANLTAKLYDVVIIEPRKKIDDVGLGNDVIVRFEGENMDKTFTILGKDDSNPRDGWLSQESPLGSLLLGKKSGNKIEYHLPDGKPQSMIVKAILPGSF